MRLTRGLTTVILMAAALPLGGCGAGYYWQASMGHLELMRQRRPIAAVVEDPATSAEVAAKLRTATDAVTFAHVELGLPDNGSYRYYADTGRPYVVWNVVAAPEFSLEPRTWCFPVAGCISYRGYFAEEKADAFATGLADDGDDIYVGGVAAYSTLGRFEDPILNTMIGYADYQLAGLIFHELAHQRIYVQDDSAFNEGFASFVEREGLHRWLASRDDGTDLRSFCLSLERRAQVTNLLTTYRARLQAWYGGDHDAADMRAGKADIFRALTDDYGELRAQWQSPPYFDGWFAGPLNNARIVALATYGDYVPAFAVLLSQVGGDLELFYARAGELGQLPADDREERLQALLESPAASQGALPPACFRGVDP